jgi:hypothetical protein
MKKVMLLVALALIAAACHKQEKPEVNCNEAVTQFKNNLQGNYEQVGFKNNLFPEWSYTSSGAQFSITSDSITDPFSTKYLVLDQSTIMLLHSQDLVKVSFGDTVLFAFQDGDSLKLIKL